MLEPIAFLPLDGPPPPPPEDFQADGLQAARAHLRVLVVDDEPLIAQTVAAILNAHGFEARESTSAEDALRIARAFRPDIVLSDVLMPRMNGVDLGVRLSRELPDTRVLLFSGQAATSELMRRAEEQGYHFELFPKPIHPDELIARLRGLT
ncbi:MAG TPA: response regulator [Acidobacteriaceae bacterium]|nr:response regulator [Acidobacteriaceae bacterium]